MKMDIIENFNEAGRFTGRLFKNIGNLVILIVLAIIPIVDFIFLGYLGKLIREGRSLDEPPKLSDYGKLFVNGLKIIIAVIVYAIIPAIILGVLALPFMHTFSLGFLVSPMAFIGSIFAYVVIAVVIFFVFSIFGVAAIGNMIRNDRFMKIFAFGEAWAIISKTGFGKYLTWLVLVFILGLIGSAFGALNWILGAIVSVFIGIFVVRSFSTLLDEALGQATQPPAVTVNPPAPPSP
ncbi:MAG: DUF4013 domain-containing protein [Nitrososphaeria archaeon]|jgi:hypothetical protein